MTAIQPSSAFDGREPEAPQLLARHYDELRRIARRIICTDAQRHAMQATGLVNETVLRLIRAGLESVDEREHLLADPELQESTGQKVSITITRRGGDKFFAGSGHTMDEILKLATENQPLPKFPPVGTLRTKAAVRL